MAGMDSRSISGVVTRRIRWKWIVGATVAVAVCLAIKQVNGPEQASAKNPFAKPKVESPARSAEAATGNRQASATSTGEANPELMATVNGEQISRNELAARCIRYFGKEVLTSLINKQLIVQYCKDNKIVIKNEDVTKEIERMAETFKLPTSQYLNMLKEERHISPTQYANEIIWPNLALRRMAAASDMQVSEKELAEAYETEYGPAVSVRLIACDDLKKAEDLHQKATANPKDFPRLAKQFSDDKNSAAANGRIQPIRKHLGDKEIERAAFSMKEGEISEIMQVGHQYVFFKCEQHIPARNIPMKNVEEPLRKSILDQKERESAHRVFKQLQDKAKVENVFNDPVKSRQYPGVAAIVNGRQITVGQLGKDCVERHGEEILSGMITRRILEQACKKRKINVTDRDIEDEIARAAIAAGQVNKKGEPNFDAWIKLVNEEQGLSEETYVQDVVWPSVALKKLVGDTVEVTDEDIQKGFEANYGERVKCMAIVLDNQRRAQEVWEKAQKKNTDEHFGDLAAAYSVDGLSSSNHGLVPPIQQHGGQPLLEKEAFELKPGENSGIIQIGQEQFVILRCLGRTEKMNISLDDLYSKESKTTIRDLLYADLHEKKLRLEMAKTMDRLYEAAAIDNYVAGTIQAGTVQSAQRGKPRELPDTGPAEPINAKARPAAGRRTSTR